MNLLGAATISGRSALELAWQQLFSDFFVRTGVYWNAK